LSNNFLHQVVTTPLIYLFHMKTWRDINQYSKKSHKTKEKNQITPPQNKQTNKQTQNHHNGFW